MKYWSMMLAFAAVMFVVVHTALTVALWLGTKPLKRFADSLSARGASELFFYARLAPLLGAIASILLIVVPGFLKHEPPGGGSDRVSIVLLGALVASVVPLFSAALTSVRVFCASERLRSSLAAGTKPLDLSDRPDVPTFEVVMDGPLLALVGLRDPALFISSQTLRSLDEEELRAAVQHELAHDRSADLWKRWLLASMPGVAPFGDPLRSLAEYAQDASEEAADVFAAANNGRGGMVLASAIVKLTRAGGSAPLNPVLAAHLVESCSVVEKRISRLAEPEIKTSRDLKPALIAAVTPAIVALYAFYAEILSGTHSLLEHLAR